MSSLRLDLGALDLVSADGGYGQYWFHALADGFTAGSPDAVKAITATLWRDGDRSRINRFGNRVVSFDVQINAPDCAALGLGEQALWLQCQASSLTLTIVHPDGFTSGTVYEVLNATLDPGQLDDLALLRDVVSAVYTLTLECRPWPRSTTLTSLSTLCASDDPTIIPLTVPGSSPTEATITCTGAGAANMETLILFTDPALSDYDPSDSASWASAPEGTYEVWLKSPGITDDVLTATVGTQVARTRLDGTLTNWAPIGSLDLGGRRDGTLGAFSLAVARNGSPVASPTVRLFRKDDLETSLTFLEPFAKHQLIVDSPGLGHDFGGVWGDGVSLLDDVAAWDFPRVIPPTSALYVEGHANAGADFTTLVEFYARWHTTAAS